MRNVKKSMMRAHQGIFVEAIKTNPKIMPQAYNNLGRCYEMLQHDRESITY